MCDESFGQNRSEHRKLPVAEAVGTILAHDITEIRPNEFKGRAFQKGHVIREEDVCHLQRLGKDNLFVLDLRDDEMHEDDAAYALAHALMGHGVNMKDLPKEGKITLIADYDGILKVNKEALLAFNMLGEVMCATLHGNTMVAKGQEIAATRAIPLVVKRSVVEEAVRIVSEAKGLGSWVKGQGKAQSEPCPMPPRPRFYRDMNRGGHAPCCTGAIEVKQLRRPKVGIVITGNEVFHGRITDAFAPVIRKKIEAVHGEIVGVAYAPDDVTIIEERMREMLNAGADLLITTGGMSVDTDDVTRFAIRNLGATDIVYGSAVLPGAMFLVGYLEQSGVRSEELGGGPQLDPCPMTLDPVPILGIPACGMYASTTVLDIILPRVLCGEKIGRRELAELGHGGLCMQCNVCRYPLCPFGK